jgi:hypothetical protein
MLNLVRALARAAALADHHCEQRSAFDGAAPETQLHRTLHSKDGAANENSGDGF